MEQYHSDSHHSKEGVQLPAPTSMPMVLAFGITLLGAGLVTHYLVTITGAIVTAYSIVGWWKVVIPHEEHELSPVVPEVLRAQPVRTKGRSVLRLQVGENHHRMHVPERVHPYRAGAWGGLAGAAAMAILACLYGILDQHSIWYPINLLAATVIPSISGSNVEALRQFNGPAFAVATVSHLLLSVFVGILYAVTLPMFPKRAPLWAGFIVPIMWTAMIAATLTMTNPVLNERINWIWFVVCQIGFGLVAGFIAAKSQRIDSMHNLSFLERAAFEGQFGIGHSDKEN